MEDYKKFLEVLMISNKNVRFSAICNLQGDLLFQRRREDIKTLFSLEETHDQLNRSIDSWKSKSEIKEKVGKPLYSVTSYEKIRRVTMHIGNDHLLFISIDNNEDEVEKFKDTNVKNISKLLENQ